MRYLVIITLLCMVYCKSYCQNTRCISDNDSISLCNEIDSLIGTWTELKSVSIKVSYENGRFTKTESTICCNVCSSITLKGNMTGTVLDPSNKESFFDWSIIHGNIHIKSNKESFFGKNEEFQYKLYHDSTNQYLELIDPEGKYKYVLIK